MNFKQTLDIIEYECNARILQRTPYDLLDAELIMLKDAEGMSASERALAEAIIDDKKSKLKRRLLSTIRFIGELFKENLLKSTIMYECIDNLIAITDADGNFVSFKPTQDEQFIELLCRLLHTMGGKLEMLETDTTPMPLTFYFAELIKLSRDKRLNSRIRFSLEEVIELRRNKWQSRREEEGPAKLDQIHEKAAAEELAKQQWSAGGGGGGHQQQNRFNSQQGQGQGHDARGPRHGQGQGQDRSGFQTSRDNQGQGGYQDQRNGPDNRGFRSGQNGQDQHQNQNSNQGRGPNRQQPQQQQQHHQQQQQQHHQQQSQSGQQRGHDHQQQQQPSSSSHTPTIATLSDDEILKRATITVDDYLRVRDSVEAVKSMQELPPSAVRVVIQKVHILPLGLDPYLQLLCIQLHFFASPKIYPR